MVRAGRSGRGSRGCRQRSGDRRSDDAGHGSDHQDAEKDGTIEEQDINRPTISKKITKINPSLFPMDTILREIETVPCKSVEYQYYSVRGRGVQSKIKTAYAVSGEASGAKQITVTNAHIFSVDGNVLFPTFEVDNDTKRRLSCRIGRHLAQSAHLPHRRHRRYQPRQNHDFPAQRGNAARAAGRYAALSSRRRQARKRGYVRRPQPDAVQRQQLLPNPHDDRIGSVSTRNSPRKTYSSGCST